MPALTRPRHEAFAQAIFRGLASPDLYPTNGHAYNAAGYRASTERNASAASAEAAASRLLRKVKILDRVAELQHEAAANARESIDKLVRELNQDREQARSLDMPSAASAATMGKAKLLGLVTDKHADVSERRDFTKANTLNDVGIGLLQSVGYVGNPLPSDVALALDCHARMIEQLEAIAERAQAGSQS